MKIEILAPKEISIQWIFITLPVEYGDEDMPLDFPLRDGDKWNAKINIDTGKIEGWPIGRSGEFYMKVRDSGKYCLLGKDNEIIKAIHDYVPNGVIPGEYGDYVNLKINEEGAITNWPQNPSVKEFFDQE